MEHKYKISKQLDPFIDAYADNIDSDVYSGAESFRIVMLLTGMDSKGFVIAEDEIFDIIVDNEIEIDADGEATLAEYVRLNEFVTPLDRDDLITGILNVDAIADVDAKYSNSLHLKEKIEKELSDLDEYEIYNFAVDYEYLIIHPSTFQVEFVMNVEDVPDGCSCFKTEQFISKGYDFNDYERKIFHGCQFNEASIQKFTELDFMEYYEKWPDRFYDHIDYPVDYYEYEKEYDHPHDSLMQKEDNNTMTTTEYIESLKISENVFELQEDTTICYLSHYVAPYTGDGEIVVPAGMRFAAYGPMRDDAMYMDLVGENEELHARMVEQEKAGCPQLANRLMGFSFFITEEEVEKLNLKYVEGSKERLLEIFHLIREANRVKCTTTYYNNTVFNESEGHVSDVGDDLPF